MRRAKCDSGEVRLPRQVLHRTGARGVQQQVGQRAQQKRRRRGGEEGEGGTRRIKSENHSQRFRETLSIRGWRAGLCYGMVLERFWKGFGVNSDLRLDRFRNGYEIAFNWCHKDVMYLNVFMYGVRLIL